MQELHRLEGNSRQQLQYAVYTGGPAGALHHVCGSIADYQCLALKAYVTVAESSIAGAAARTAQYVDETAPAPRTNADQVPQAATGTSSPDASAEAPRATSSRNSQGVAQRMCSVASMPLLPSGRCYGCVRREQ